MLFLFDNITAFLSLFSLCEMNVVVIATFNVINYLFLCCLYYIMTNDVFNNQNLNMTDSLSLDGSKSDPWGTPQVIYSLWDNVVPK